jgi:bifunctional non-homologous end joining protein LigD
MEIDGRVLSVSNLDKVLYPEVGFTKGQVLDYYARIASVMLPHVRERPITLKRYPNGVDSSSFFEKHASAKTPSWVQTTEVPSADQSREPVTFAVVNDRATLLWAANLAAIEFHVPLWHLSKRSAPPRPPDHMVFDLDPGAGTSIVECCRVAGWLAARLGQDRLVAKTSGSKGLQLYLRVARTNWPEESARAHELALQIEKDHPDDVVAVMRKALRNGKVLIDWSQNSPSKTTVAVYSLRARPRPTVSTPVTWDEIYACTKSGDPNDLRFEAKAVLSRVEDLGDLMSPLLDTGSKPRIARTSNAR